MDRFEKPAEKVDTVDACFGLGWDNIGQLTLQALLPTRDEIPEVFKKYHGTKWNELAHKWFFEGLRPDEMPKEKEEINRSAALRHLSTLLRTSEIEHNHKEAAVAYLMSLWFEA